ncbi:MAG TPA: hypothetical protein VLF67_01905 [Candidatus Saccharimonas sp.]|nr:hypothetical protein [Candidatus Saccharimonas sp.]
MDATPTPGSELDQLNDQLRQEHPHHALVQDILTDLLRLRFCLVAERRRQRITQAEIARRMFLQGVANPSRSRRMLAEKHIRDFEENNTRPDLMFLAKYIAALGLDMRPLLAGFIDTLEAGFLALPDA